MSHIIISFAFNRVNDKDIGLMSHIMISFCLERKPFTKIIHVRKNDYWRLKDA